MQCGATMEMEVEFVPYAWAYLVFDEISTRYRREITLYAMRGENARVDLDLRQLTMYFSSR
jgi:hypothetical protein